MLTVRGLAAETGLELVTGEDAADAPVRWVHISELPDPTPWLSGGELLLTTGLQLQTAGKQRQFMLWGLRGQGVFRGPEVEARDGSYRGGRHRRGVHGTDRTLVRSREKPGQMRCPQAPSALRAPMAITSNAGPRSERPLPAQPM